MYPQYQYTASSSAVFPFLPSISPASLQNVFIKQSGEIYEEHLHRQAPHRPYFRTNKFDGHKSKPAICIFWISACNLPIVRNGTVFGTVLHACIIAVKLELVLYRI